MANEKRVKSFSTKGPSSIDEAARTIVFVASTETPDRMGDVVRVAGWDTAAYSKNPVFLWAHDSSQLPVGKCVELNKQLGANPALVMKIQFATAEENPFADNVFKLYKGGHLSAVSVGFIPHEMSFRTDEEIGCITGCEFTKQELLELSAVPVPANSEALALSMRKDAPSTDAGVAAFLKSLVEAPDAEMEKFLKALTAAA